MAKGKFICLLCGEEIRHTRIYKDDLGIYKKCGLCKQGSDLTEEDTIYGLQPKDIENIGDINSPVNGIVVSELIAAEMVS